MRRIDRDKRILIGLSCLGLILLYMSQRSGQIETTPIPPIDKNTVDSYTMGIHTTRFDKQGRIKNDMRAASAAHYLQSDVSLLSDLNISSLTRQGREWQTSAENGRVLGRGDIYELWDNVVIARADGAATVKSDTLTYRSADSTAVTDSPVEILSETGKTTGVGMRANLETEVLTLLNNVQGVYRPAEK